MPRDRDGSFEPILIPKNARGMTMRETQEFLRDTYGTNVSAEFISSVTEAVMAEVTA